MRCTLSLAICALGAALAPATPLQAQDNAGASQSSAGAVASGATAKTVGVMKSISGNSLVLKSDAGPEITITYGDKTVIGGINMPAEVDKLGSFIRELALRQVAEQVDRSLESYMEAQDIRKNWGVRERMAVCISSNPTGQYLIARAARMA